MRPKPAFSARLAALLTTLSLLAAAAFGQAATGTISGRVMDPQHAMVPGATVTVTNTKLNQTRTAQTDALGRFSVADLAPGSYRVTAETHGLRLPRPQAVTLGVGGSVQVQLVLGLTAAGQQVTVTASAARVEGQTAAPAVDKNSPKVANAVAGLTVTYLPNRDRDFTEFGALAAGAHATSSGLQVVGQRADATQVEVDGESFTDPLEGGRRGGKDGGLFFPQTVVQEFQLVHAGATAEVGDTNGGFLNVATKQGSNGLHGEWFYIGRPAAWTGTDAFGHALSDTQNEFGASMGGDVVKNRVFYYGGFEQDLISIPYWTQFQPQAAAAPALPAALAAQQSQTVGHDHPLALSLRLDAALDSHNSLNLEGNFNRVRYSQVNPDSTETYATASNGLSLSGQSDWVRANLTSAWGGLVNQVLAQWAGDRRDFMPVSTAPEVVINGFGTLGGNALGPHRYVSDQRGISEDIAWNWHGQMVHFGGGFDYDPATEFQQANLNGRYDYDSLGDYLAGDVRRFQQTFGAGTGSLLYQATERRANFWINDRVPLGEALTLTAGLRWDGQWNPQPPQPNSAIPGTSLTPNDLRQWQPRLGLAWNPHSSTVVRLSAGLYDAPTPATLFQRVFTDNGLNATIADSDYDPQLLALAAGGNGLAAAPSGLTTPAALAIGIDPGFRNPRSFQTAASFEQQLGKRFTLTTGYNHDSTWDLQQMLDTNLFAPTLDADGMPIFPASRPLAGVGQLLTNESNAHSTYDGWLSTLDFKGPYSLGLTANYTLARARDDASQQSPFGPFTALNPFDLATDAAYSNQDIRSSFNISGTDRLPYGFKVNPIFIVHSGLPYTPVIGFDTQNDGNDLNDRAIINGQVAARNSLRQPGMVDLDIRFVKDVTLPGHGHHLDLFLDVFNITNHANRTFDANALSFYGTAAEPVFGAGLPLFAPSTTGFGAPRQIQFTARMVVF